MNLQSLQKLTSRYGVRATGPVRWKHFLGHFMRPVSEEESTRLHMDRTSEPPAPNKDDMNLQDIYPRLKEIFHLLDTKTDDSITRADLRHLLQRSGGTQPNNPQPRLSYSQITEVLNVLDPGHTGFVQFSTLETLDPNTTFVSTGNYQALVSLANTAEPGETKDTASNSEEQKPPDEKHSTQWADKVSLASASWRTVENVLLDKLYEQLSSVLEALKLSDPQRTGYIKKEDLKKVLNRFGASISDADFNKLCESSCRPGSSSTLVSYSDFLTNLGVSLTDEVHPVSPCCSHMRNHHTERPSPQLTVQSVRGLPSPSSPPVSPDAHSVLDVVFKRMRLRLEQRNSSLTDRIQVITQSSDGTLTEADVRKILEDGWVILDDNSFNKFTELLGLIDGQIERSVFLAKYEEVAARARSQSWEVQDDKDQVKVLLTSAEQCMAAMKTRIKKLFGDNLTAFRLMDKKRRGIVDSHDFKALYSRLGFFCSEDEYERLLDLIGLQPGGNLNFTEFVEAVENSGKRKRGTPAAFVQEQLHQLLASEARNKWASVSKTLCKFDTEGQAWIHKGSLRGLLFTYALPISPDEFQQLWLRYDPEGRGCVSVCDFLEKLGFHHDGETRPQSQNVNQQDSARPVSSDASSLEHIEQILQENYKGFSNALTHLGTRRDGTVTVKDLLNLLQTYNCSIQREQLVNHLHRFKVAMDDDCLRLSYMDFLSAFDHKVEKKPDPPPASPNAMHPIESLESLSPARALERMQELVSASAPYLYKAFSAFDQSETGTVRALDFRKILENFCARLSDKQYKHMLTKLELNCESCTVNWKNFLNNFQSQRQLISEKCLSRTSQRSPKTRTPDPQTRSCGTIEVWNEISKTITDLDGITISKEQFRQLCERHCLGLTNDQLECVWNQMPVNEQGQLQHKEFVKCFGALGRTPHTGAGSLTNSNPPPSSESRETGSATKPCCQNTTGALLQRTKSAPQSTPRRPPSLGRPGTGNPLASVERRLRMAVQRCWKEIQRSCSKKDPQQEGQISAISFLEILHSLNIVLTWEQLDHLALKFDIMNNSQVSYKNFLHHFLLNLRPEENKKAFERRKLPRLSSQMSQGVLSTDFVEVMLRMYEAVRSSWTSIRRSFLASDRNRMGSVSVQVFRKVLLHFGVNLSEEEFFHLTSYFDASTTGKICYNSFLWAFLH
ncbi:EF-hand calcium-binding domain-containing protein 6-like [Sphaeramia orbicularis]|uniref:EF-hand calcium-binding domain-containing protein 6-like n=1 Tax=Sphaeramia orbicularis TaxID=375764 RepID=UPI00117BF5F2|nr:EF-hand calcium-binding domain-containing protein 6 [Sphaeramia orbicularis]